MLVQILTIGSEKCKEVIQAANNRQESRDVTALLTYELIYRHTIPRRAANLARASLPPLSIEGWAFR